MHIVQNHYVSFMSSNILSSCLFLCWGSHYDTNSPLITTRIATGYFATVAILNSYTVHDLNGLDAYTLYTVHEQDLVVVRHERTSTCMLLFTCYTARDVICAYIVCVPLASISWNFFSNSHASVKFELSCTVHHQLTPIVLVSALHINAKATPTNSTDYSCHVTAVELV